MAKKTMSDWQQINQSLQAIHEKEVVAAAGRQSILTLSAIVLLGVLGLGILIHQGLSTASRQREQFEEVVLQSMSSPSVDPVLEEVETSSSSEDTVGPALRQIYRARRDDYVFSWDVASFEALTDRYSLAWDDKRQPISLDEVVAQQGKPSLLEHEEGWVYVTYSERFVDHLYEIGQYDQKVTLAFKEENGVWVLQEKVMNYMATDELKTLVEGTPFKSRMIEGTNQKAYLRDLVRPLAEGLADNGQGGASLEEALDLLGLPTAYGFWYDSRTFVLVYEDVDKVYLRFERQEDGTYLLAKWD